MLGFLIGGEVNDDAVRLKTLMDLALQKYARLPRAQLKLSIENEFEKDLRDTDLHNVYFAYAELDDFTFCLDLEETEGFERTLTVTGIGKYAGIMIQATPDGNRYFNIGDGIAFEPTGGARKMGAILEKKFGIANMTKKLGALLGDES